ncbi:RICIN domain-containing protein [Candidatus Sumerlaeota bacterium]|nr:RICIN domain-containing protein [Candidatus Sumerlaeota bacterium]
MRSQSKSSNLKVLFAGLMISFGLTMQPYASITYTLHLDGVDSSIASAISSAMAEAVSLYNANGTFTKSLHVYYSSGVPTAQANYDGVITFGGSRNTRVAMHEISHTLGIGTYSAYWNLMTGGNWDGGNAVRKLKSFDGASAVLKGDSVHFWPYGLNYDSEDGTTARVRHVQIVQAFQSDMGLNSLGNVGGITTGSSKYLVNRSASKVLTAAAATNGSNVSIATKVSSTAQKWTIASSGAGRISLRSAQTGARAIDTWSWGTVNGTNLALYDYYSNACQQYIAYNVSGSYYAIFPSHATGGVQCADAFGTSSGSNVGTWSYWGGTNQQWYVQ